MGADEFEPVGMWTMLEIADTIVDVAFVWDKISEGKVLVVVITADIILGALEFADWRKRFGLLSAGSSAKYKKKEIKLRSSRASKP